MEFGEGAILTQRHRDSEISTENTKGSSSLCLSLCLCVEDQSSHSTLKTPHSEAQHALGEEDAAEAAEALIVCKYG